MLLRQRICPWGQRPQIIAVPYLLHTGDKDTSFHQYATVGNL